MSLFYEFFRRLGKKENRDPLLTANGKAGVNNTKSLSSNSKKITYNAENSEKSQETSSSRDGKSFKFNEDGRRYHGNDEVAYPLPNDDDETDRLHSQHWILRYVLQRNYHAPVTEMLEEGITVLDSGCGPATWTFEMSETYPQSKFCGVDVSFVFPETIKPTNVELLIANIAKQIPYPDNTFDYIHQRLLVAGLTHDDWGNALKELYRVLKPGGYIELSESSLCDIVNCGPAWQKMQDATTGLFKSLNIPEKVSSELESRLLAAGFVDTVLQITALPFNHDGKRGKLLWGDLRHGYKNMRPSMAKVFPEWEDPDAYEAHLKLCDIEAERNKVCINWYVCYARKPSN